VPTELLKHNSNGRTLTITDDQGQPTAQRVYKSFVGQKNVDLGDGNFAPYVWDEPGQSIRYSDKVCEFDVDGFQTIREFGSVETLIDDQRFEVQYLRGNWRTLDLWQIGLTVDQQDDYCVVTRHLSDGEGNTLDVDFLFKPWEKVKLTFRLHVVNANLYRIRFQNTGIAGEVTEVPLIDKDKNNLGISRLLFTNISFAWDESEIGIHEGYTIEDQAGGKKLDFFLGDFDLPADGNVTISPTTWGPNEISETNNDSGGGVDIDGQTSNVLYIDDGDTYPDWGWVGFRWEGIDLGGAPASIDSGTIIEFDCLDDNNNPSGTLRFVAEDAQDPVDFSVTDVEDRSYLTGGGDYVDHALPDGARNDEAYSMVNPVQALIDEGYTYDGTAGNDTLVFACGANGAFDITSVSWRSVSYDYSHATGEVARLTIVYTEGGGSSPSASPSASVSVSPSVSISASPSVSPSVSISASPSVSVSASPSASPSCPAGCGSCTEYIDVNFSGLSGTCEVDCVDYNTTYQLARVGATCVWQYVDGVLIINIVCEEPNWVLEINNNDSTCGKWTAPMASYPTCPPTISS